MTINEYQKEALRTANGMNYEGHNMLTNGVMGLCGESGECVDLMKKHLFQGHELDKAHLAKELGDVAWYLAVTAYALGYDLEAVLQMNVDKLRARYPDGFDADKSLHRKEGDV
jgi:NTP pyrophosphatase (non-canonical NTP hydrolase)